MVERSELKKILPHGSGRIIAERAGVSYQSVSNYFSHKNNSERIEMAALEVASEMCIKKKGLIQNITLA